MAQSPADISKNFCVMPWTNLATETNGKCKICCIVMTNRYIKKEDGSDFEIQSDPIEDIWNSNYVRHIRKKMLAGEWVSDCFYCQGQETQNQKSPRQSYNETWFNQSVAEKVLESKAKDGHVSALPTSLEPRPGILCNLKCNMCWSLSSSKIFAERKTALENNQEDIPKFLRDEWKNEVEWASQSDFAWSEKPTYLENFKKCMPTLQRLYFTGGEPTLIKSNLSILRQLIAAGRTDLLISFTTNLQVLPQEWLDILPHFSRVEITGSIDGVGPVNDYIRFPSQWKDVQENLKKLYALHPRLEVSIISVVQATNIFGYVDLIRWVAQNFQERQIQIIPTMLHGPNFLRPEILDFDLRQQAVKYIDEALSDLSIMQKNKDFLQDVRSQILNPHKDAIQLRKKFSEYMKYLDRTRKTNFSETFPQLSSMVEEI